MTYVLRDAMGNDGRDSQRQRVEAPSHPTIPVVGCALSSNHCVEHCDEFGALPYIAFENNRSHAPSPPSRYTAATTASNAFANACFHSASLMRSAPCAYCNISSIRQFLASGNEWSVGGQWEVDSWVWDQVGLELDEINIEGSIETKRGSDRRHNLGDDTVQVGVAWTINAEVSTADIVDGFVVNHEGTVGVLKGGMGGKNRVVWLNNSGRNLWSWVDGELQLGFLSVVDRKTLHEKRESLESAAVISKTADSVENGVDQFLSDGVVTTSIIVGGVFLSGDHLLWVEKLLVGSRANLVCKSSFLNRARPHVKDINLPTTVGSRSTKIERGTYLPFPVSEKKVVKDSPSAFWSDGIVQ
ncbi:hypothetical protein GCK72_000638 [Caenorhabditis remanei]|uniref:Uncharacterized protein n=1 Tax=Caenorhabditis remanei TaxID=31234 RepID=A0A6A5HMM0_CAERE|nr:hypothetical protein GCK72_000638 [Caenorhabditis remanei]KAF1768825.1 hypothetical protein GCK72_000638 [Caenorhabditis remanei]